MIQDIDRKHCRHAKKPDWEKHTIQCNSNWLIHRDRLHVQASFCQTCPYHDRRNRWPMLGDAIASALGWLGFKKSKTCGCVQRQSRLNFWGLRLAIGRLRKQ
jgi:hypothetical protein